MSARRKRVISTYEIQFNHRPAKMLLTEKKGVSQNGQTPNIIGICSYCVLDRPVFEWNQVLLHREMTPWWSFLLADGAHIKTVTCLIMNLVASILKGTAHLKQHLYQIAIFSSGMKIFKIAFQHIVGNSCMVPIAPFSATNFNHMTLF